MAFTVTLKNLGAFAAASNLQLFLRKTSDNSLLNTGGDTGSDASSIGSFTWTIAEDRPAEQMLARIYEGSTETAANIVIDSVLNVGFTEIGQEAAELDSASRAAILTQELIESYAADGAAPTVAQALMMLLQHHQQKSVSGTTVTIKKLDKSTTAGTYTLDSATDPTSITRAT